MNLLLEVKNQLTPYISADRPIVVALSGGVDSVVLLHLLVELNKAQLFPLAAIHIHHGLSDHADDWVTHCQKLCQAWQVPLQVGYAKLSRKSRESLEALAREARYKLLQSLSPADAVLITGQHMDDQAETFLIRLKRGSGPSGLASMPNVRALDEDRLLVRPLLNITRSQVLQYARQHNLSWVEDESNHSIDFDRNFLRKDVLPILKARWPSIHKSIARSAQLCQEQSDLAKEVAINDLLKVETYNNLNGNIYNRLQPSLPIWGLSELSTIRQNNLIRYWLAIHHRAMPSLVQLQELLSQLANARQDSSISIRVDSYELRTYRQHLFIVDVEDEQNKQAIDLSFQTHRHLTFLLERHRVDCSNLPNSDAFRWQTQLTRSIKCQPINRRAGSRSLKQLLHEYHVPPWLRQEVLYLTHDQEVIAAIGLFFCEVSIPNFVLEKCITIK